MSTFEVVIDLSLLVLVAAFAMVARGERVRRGRIAWNLRQMRAESDARWKYGSPGGQTSTDCQPGEHRELVGTIGRNGAKWLYCGNSGCGWTANRK